MSQKSTTPVRLIIASLFVGIPCAQGRPEPIPENDDLADRAILESRLPLDFSVNVEGGSTELTEPLPDPRKTSTTWYEWIAPETRRVLVTGLGLYQEPDVAIYTGDLLPNLTPVDSGGVFSAVMGTTYKIRFANRPGEAARFRGLILPLTETGEMPNDVLAGRTNLGNAKELTVYGSIRFAKATRPRPSRDT